MFIIAEKGGVSRAKGVEEKEKECTAELEPSCNVPGTDWTLRRMHTVSSRGG